MIWVGDNIQTVHSDSEKIWQNAFVGVDNENPTLSMVEPKLMPEFTVSEILPEIPI